MQRSLKAVKIWKEEEEKMKLIEAQVGPRCVIISALALMGETDPSLLDASKIAGLKTRTNQR